LSEISICFILFSRNGLSYVCLFATSLFLMKKSTYYRIYTSGDYVVRWHVFDVHLLISFLTVRHNLGCGI
jgi:hypothetical protein